MPRSRHLREFEPDAWRPDKATPLGGAGGMSKVNPVESALACARELSGTLRTCDQTFPSSTIDLKGTMLRHPFDHRSSATNSTGVRAIPQLPQAF